MDDFFSIDPMDEALLRGRTEKGPRPAQEPLVAAKDRQRHLLVLR